jgi:four helix bundle protein
VEKTGQGRFWIAGNRRLPIEEERIMKDKAFNLEARLVIFAVRVIHAAQSLPKNATGNHIRNQLLRCGTSPAPNYGEAQSAESRADFTHKLKIVLKELRETRVWLLMIQQAQLEKLPAILDDLIRETNELTAIFVASLKTVTRNDD